MKIAALFKKRKNTKENSSSKIHEKVGFLESIKKEFSYLFTDYTSYSFTGIDYVVAAVTGLICLVIYTFTLTPSISSGDNGELTVAAHYLGVAHAPAYPLHSLLGKLFTFIPYGNIAWRVNFFSAFSGAVFVALTVLVAIKVLAMMNIEKTTKVFTLLGASAGGLALGLSRAVWSQATIAEVYTVSAIFYPAIVLLLIDWLQYVAAQSKKTPTPLPRELYGERHLLALGMLYGLALGGHHTILMLEFFIVFAILIVLIHFVILKENLFKLFKKSGPPFLVLIGFIVMWIVYYKTIMSTSSNFFINDYERLKTGLSVFFAINFVMLLHWVFYRFIKRDEEDLMLQFSLTVVKGFFFLYMGFAIYGYMWIRSHDGPPINWGGISEETTFIGKAAKFFFVIHRKQFNSSDLPLSFSSITVLFSHLANPVHWVQFPAAAWVAALVGLFSFSRLFTFFITIFIFGIVSFTVQLTFFIRFPISTESLEGVEIFYFFSFFLISLFIAAGTTTLLVWIKKLIDFLLPGGKSNFSIRGLEKVKVGNGHRKDQLKKGLLHGEEQIENDKAVSVGNISDLKEGSEQRETSDTETEKKDESKDKGEPS